MNFKSDISAYARSLGFERIGFTSADPLMEAEAFLGTWLEQGRAGEMDYLEKDPTRRTRPADHLPGAKTVIALAMNYYQTSSASEGPPEGRVSRYAWGRDYHKVIGKRLEAFIRYMQVLAPQDAFKSFVDTGALLERPFAQRAGLGFIGKNTMLITHGLGSWVFLANIITTMDLPVDAPDPRSCGACRLCIDACPTQAITAPYQLDSRRCIAYLTIELEGKIENELRDKTAGWIFGCDVCQDVCPHNTRIPQTPIKAFRAPEGSVAMLSLADILSMRTEDDFQRQCERTPLKRAGRQGLLRNACLAAANLGRKDLVPLLRTLCAPEEHPVIREHALWALEVLDLETVRAG